MPDNLAIAHLFLRGRCCVDSERLSSRADQPSVSKLALVLERLQLHLLQGNDVLLVVLLLVDDNVAVDEQVVEEEELARLQLLSAGLCEHALADEHPAGDGQRLARRPEAALDERDATRVRLAVHWKERRL